MLSIAWAALILGERPGPAIYAGLAIVPAVAALAIRARTQPKPNTADRRTYQGA